MFDEDRIKASGEPPGGRNGGRKLGARKKENKATPHTHLPRSIRRVSALALRQRRLLAVDAVRRSRLVGGLRSSSGQGTGGFVGGGGGKLRGWPKRIIL